MTSNRKLFHEFINKYKELECLWKVSDMDYRNKQKRINAMKELVKILRKADETANIKTVTRKINAMRSAFNKERNKVKASYLSDAGNEAVHVPRLWYYNKLLFLVHKNELTRTSIDIAGMLDSSSQSSEKYTPQINKKRKLAAEDQAKGHVKVELQLENSNIESIKYGSANDSDHGNQSNGSADHESVNSDPLDEHQIVYKNDSGYRLETGLFQNLSEYEAVGINVGKKLSKMDPTQALYAESIINNVLRKGLLKKLKEATDLCDNVCGCRL